MMHSSFLYLQNPEVALKQPNLLMSFNNDYSQPLSLIDTIGFNDPTKNEDAEIIADLVTKLKNKVDYINTFVIAVNGTDPRLDGSLIAMIKIFEEMFGKEFWKQTLIVFTKLQMSKSSIKRREKTNKKKDFELAQGYIKDLQSKFPNSGGIDYLILDATYEEEDEHEANAFQVSMEKLWRKIQVSPNLATDKVKMAQTENKKLRDKIQRNEEEMIRKDKEIKEKKQVNLEKTDNNVNMNKIGESGMMREERETKIVEREKRI